jgi:hypothetical protein
MFIDLVTANPDRFVLRFWNYTQHEHERLLEVFGHLANGAGETRLGLSSPAFGIDSVVMKAGLKDRGARIHASANSVLWELDPGGWRSARDLAARVEAGSTRFQWLDEQAEVPVLLPPTGRW